MYESEDTGDIGVYESPPTPGWFIGKYEPGLSFLFMGRYACGGPVAPSAEAFTHVFICAAIDTPGALALM